MATYDASAVEHTVAGTKIEFYQQASGAIRIRVYATAKSFDYEVILTAGQYAALVAALVGSGTSYSTPALAPGGADHTVNV